MFDNEIKFVILLKSYQHVDKQHKHIIALQSLKHSIINIPDNEAKRHGPIEFLRH